MIRILALSSIICKAEKRSDELTTNGNSIVKCMEMKSKCDAFKKAHSYIKNSSCKETEACVYVKESCAGYTRFQVNERSKVTASFNPQGLSREN